MDLRPPSIASLLVFSVRHDPAKGWRASAHRFFEIYHRTALRLACTRLEFNHTTRTRHGSREPLEPIRLPRR